VPPPDMRTPTSAKVGGAVDVEGVTANSYSLPGETSTVIIVAKAVQNVRLAACHLREAMFLLDDAEIRCEALDILAADTSAVLALWAGRKVTAVEAVAKEDARDWRKSYERNC